MLITGSGVELGLTLGLALGVGFCAKALKGDKPTAVVTVASRKPRRVVLINDQLPFAGSDARTVAPLCFFK